MRWLFEFVDSMLYDAWASIFFRAKFLFYGDRESRYLSAEYEGDELPPFD